MNLDEKEWGVVSIHPMMVAGCVVSAVFVTHNEDKERFGWMVMDAEGYSGFAEFERIEAPPEGIVSLGMKGPLEARMARRTRALTEAIKKYLAGWSGA